MAADGPTLVSNFQHYSGGTGGGLYAVWDAAAQTVTVKNVGGIALSGAPSIPSLEIDAGITLVWEAEFEGGTTAGNALINLTMAGNFEVAPGGSIRNSGAGEAIRNSSTGTVYVSGGEVAAEGGVAIHNFQNGEINISGGNVSAGTGTAIRNSSTGVIKVSNSAVVYSTNSNPAAGTIVLENAGPNTDTRLMITGGIVFNMSSSAGARAVNNLSVGKVEIKDNAVLMTNAGIAVYNASTGEIGVSAELIQSATGTAIYNASTGVVSTLGGKIKTLSESASSNAIYNHSTGAVIVSGGTIVSANAGVAIYNQDEGVITINSGNISSENTSPTAGTIYLADQGAGTGSRLIINEGSVYNEQINGTSIYNASTGGVEIDKATVISWHGTAVINNNTGDVTISNSTLRSLAIVISNNSTGVVTVSSNSMVFGVWGIAIQNNNTGAITVSNSTVDGGPGIAIRNNNTGVITVSNSAHITSVNNNLGEGTIVLSGGTSNSAPRLIITDASVENHQGLTAIINYSDGAMNISGIVGAIGGIAIRNESTGAINISDGEVNSQDGIAILNNSTGAITVSNAGSVISKNTTAGEGTIVLAGGTLNVTGGKVENYGGGTAILNNGVGAMIVSGGLVHTTGKAIELTNHASTLSVSGGFVRSTVDFAIDCSGNNNPLTVSGNAVVFAYGSVMSDVISRPSSITPTGNGLVLAWDASTGNTVYIKDSSDDLFCFPNSADVHWDIGGIFYGLLSNTGILPVDGVTVRSIGTDAGLSALSVSAGTLTPVFNSSVYSYSVDVALNDAVITLSATANDPAATVAGDGAFTLAVGSNTFTITVVAEDNTTTQNYTITVNRLPGNAVVPSAPQNLTATPGNRQVSLTWTAPSSDGGSPITGYQLSTDNYATYVTVTGNAYTFVGLTNGTTLTFRVRAINSAGAGAETSVTATPVDGVSPATYSLAIQAETGGNIILGASGNYAAGDVITLVAVADNGYAFSGWTTSGGGSFSNPNSTNATFTMPANNVTVTATFRQVDVDDEWEAARKLIEGATFILTQQEAPTSAATRNRLAGMINNLLAGAFSPNSVSIDVVILIFSPAVAGDIDNPKGVNGYFAFRVSSPGKSSSAYNEGIIIATPYKDNHTYFTVLWNNTALTYNGESQAPTAIATGSKGENLLLTVTGEKIHAGAGYTATASLTVENPNYVLINPTTLFHIAPATVDVQWSDTLLFYNGNPQLPTATATGVKDEDLPLIVAGEQTDKGVGYKATASLQVPDGDYVLNNPTATFDIFDEPPTDRYFVVQWRETLLTYNGNPQAPSATATNSQGKNVELIITGAQTYPGNGYTATASLSEKDSIYELINPITPFRIAPATCAVVWSNRLLFYNGNPQAPTATARGVKGENLPLAVHGEKTEVGTAYIATASLIVPDSNYILSNTTITFEIQEMPLSPNIFVVQWQNLSLTYNGYPQAPTAIATNSQGENVEIVIQGAQTYPGTAYTATATLSDANSMYELLNTEALFGIAPSPRPVQWSIQPLSYNGNPQAPTATVRGVFGENLPLNVTGVQINAGTGYTATASFSGIHDNYTLSGGVNLFDITSATLDIMAVSETIEPGQKPALDYSITSGRLFGNDTLNGELSVMSWNGTTLLPPYPFGIHTITQGTLTVGSNYRINFSAGTLIVAESGVEIFDIIVNDKSAVRNGDVYYAYPAENGEKQAVVYTVTNRYDTVKINGTKQNPLTVDLPDYGYNYFTLSMSAYNGNTQELTLIIERYYDKITYEYPNLPTINQHTQTNGGYTFTGFQWYRDGIAIPGANNPYCQIKDNATYYCVLTLDNDVKMRTIDIYSFLRPTGALIAFPSPTQGKVTIQRSTIPFPLDLSGKIQVFDLNGVLVMQPASNPFDMSGLPKGVYVIRINGETVKVIKTN